MLIMNFLTAFSRFEARKTYCYFTSPIILNDYIIMMVLINIETPLFLNIFWSETYCSQTNKHLLHLLQI